MFDKIGELPASSRLLVLTHSVEVAAQVEKVLHKSSVDAQVRMRVNGTRIETYLDESPAEIVLLDLDLGLPSVVDELRDFVNSTGHKVATLVTSQTSSLRDVRSLIKIGVVDFIPQPIESSDLEDAIATAKIHLEDTRPEERDRDGQIITFMHASGGAGATTLLVEATAGIALKSPPKGLAASVATIDFDVQFGNLAHNLDLSSETGLINILESPDRLDEDFLRSSMVRHESGFDVLSAPDQFVPLDALTPEIAESVLTEARDNYSFTFVDMPLAWSDWTRNVLALSDVVVMVTPVSVPAIRRTSRLLRTFHKMDLDDLTVLVVCNQVAKSVNGRGRRRDISEAISRGIDYSIQFDQQTVSAAADRGVFCHQVNEKSTATKDIAKFVEGLGHQLDLETTAEPTVSLRSSLFRRQPRPSA